MQRFNEKRKLLFNSPKGEASTSRNNKRDFVTAQRRYDNVRVRDSEMKSRLCCECGQQIFGEKKYQEHIIAHECTYLAYNLYYTEQANISSKNNKLNFTEETTQSEVKNKNKRKISEESSGRTASSSGGGSKLAKGTKNDGK
ncbi:hypothetical protein ACQ4LE_002257 [Meloidogyne hapla]|uniref:C2H2-type domain-containing protein n=1 Tax=Meloidogyne hapla TaxID=6305 RepID=A0A1I8BQK4_MELHA